MRADQWTILWQTLILVFVRVIPIVALTPIFGGPQVPKRLRTGLAIVFSLVLVGQVISFDTPALQLDKLLLLLVKEAFLGLTIAITIVVLFEILAGVGSLIDTARTVTLSGMLDPLHGVSTSSLAVFFQQFGIVLFLSAGGFQVLLRSLAESFAIFPPTQFPSTPIIGLAATSHAIALMSGVMLLSLQLAAPVLVFMLLLDLALALLQRSTQIDNQFIGNDVKASLGLLVVVLTLAMNGETFLRFVADQLARALP